MFKYTRIFLTRALSITPAKIWLVMTSGHKPSDGIYVEM